MKAVTDHVYARTQALYGHPFFRWLNGGSHPLDDRLLFSPILVEFIMGFADMNKWFLSYPSPSTKLEEAINEHTFEDRTHSRLFVEDWVKLGFNDRFGWSASDTLWWWFDCSETELIRRLAMETLDLTVNNPDPAVRFPMMEAIESVGKVFFANTVVIARELRQKTGIDYRYYGEYHVVRETGHLHADEGPFKALSLTSEQRSKALYLANRMFDMFTEEITHLLDYSRRVNEDPQRVTDDLRREHDRRMAERDGDTSRWPAGPRHGAGPIAESQARVDEVFQSRMQKLAKNQLLSWLTTADPAVSPIQKLQRFVAIWAVDILGYRDFNTYVLRYPKPSSAEERAINRWAEDLATHGVLYLDDWRALAMDQVLAWPAHKVIEYYFLDGHTEVHRHNMAKTKTYAFAHPSPALRYWLMRSLEGAGEVLFEALGPVVREIEASTPLRLPYWGHRHYLTHRPRPADAEADAVCFTSIPLSAADEKVAIDIVNCIFDNMEQQFSLSHEVATSNYFGISAESEKTALARAGARHTFAANAPAVVRSATGSGSPAKDPRREGRMGDLEAKSRDGQPRRLAKADVDDLAKAIRGEVIRPGDAAYDEARRVWNGRVDRKPALIVRCAGEDDVVAAVRFARKADVLASVRSGGHNIFGTAICEGGIVIDLSKIRDVRVDPSARRAVVGPGARWKDVDGATQQHGLAAAGGQHSDVGVGGFILGGGIGWLVRKHGLGADNLRRARVVTANGEILEASEQSNPDLFWALRGGGGNFGIVTELELELHPVGPTVTAGMVIHPLERAREVLRFFRTFAEDSPEDVHTIAVLMTAPTGQKGVALAVCREGQSAEGEQALARLRSFGTPLVDQIQPMPYTVLQWMMDGLAPPGRRYFNRSRFLRGVDEACLDQVLHHFELAPSEHCTLFLHRLGGAMARVPADATAFAHRDAEYCFVAEASWAHPSNEEKHIHWARAAEDAMARLSTGAYLNDLGREVDEGPHLRAAFGGNYDRLAAIKAKYDPDNFFSHNQNVRPAKA